MPVSAGDFSGIYTGGKSIKHEAILTAGQPLINKPRTLILLHRRGGRASDILSIANHLAVPDIALLASQAPDNSWYPASFLAPPAQNEPWLFSSLSLLTNLVESLGKQGIPQERLYFLGFSQGQKSISTSFQSVKAAFSYH
jgi:phospholipase/carboxylesterase